MKKNLISPYKIIIYSFVFIIVLGTLLLKLPISIKHEQSLSWIDAFFMATSAVCVTGLVPIVNVATTLTVFGKVVLALLIQIGGLGFVTITIYFFTLIGVKIGISERFLIREALNQDSLQGLVRLVKKIIQTTLIIELIGAFINFTVFIRDYQFLNALGISLFHAISSFNNCGFDIIGSESLIPYRNNLILNLNTSFLIILGGIGFVVINDLLNKKRFKDLTLHSKIAISTSLALIIGGTILIKLVEGSNITLLQAYFQSVAARTAGFSTVDISILKIPTLLIIIGLMFIGGSPSSTAGGIKTTTFFIICKSIVSMCIGKEPITHYRKIASITIIRAFALTIVSIFTVFVSLVIMTIFEPTVSTTRLLFEVVSAFSTTGLSANLTPHLQWYSKLLIAFMMFFGRLGPMTFISALNKNWAKIGANDVKYVEVRVAIG
jgi:trk system potassium uptake protein TrkH